MFSVLNSSDEDVNPENWETTIFQKWKAALQSNGKTLDQEIKSWFCFSAAYQSLTLSKFFNLCETCISSLVNEANGTCAIQLHMKGKQKMNAFKHVKTFILFKTIDHSL